MGLFLSILSLSPKSFSENQPFRIALSDTGFGGGKVVLVEAHLRENGLPDEIWYYGPNGGKPLVLYRGKVTQFPYRRKIRPDILKDLRSRNLVPTPPERLRTFHWGMDEGVVSSVEEAKTAQERPHFDSSTRGTNYGIVVGVENGTLVIVHDGDRGGLLVSLLPEHYGLLSDFNMLLLRNRSQSEQWYQMITIVRGSSQTINARNLQEVIKNLSSKLVGISLTPEGIEQAAKLGIYVSSTDIPFPPDPDLVEAIEMGRVEAELDYDDDWIIPPDVRTTWLVRESGEKKKGVILSRDSIVLAEEDLRSTRFHFEPDNTLVINFTGGEEIIDLSNPSRKKPFLYPLNRFETDLHQIRQRSAFVESYTKCSDQLALPIRPVRGWNGERPEIEPNFNHWQRSR